MVGTMPVRVVSLIAFGCLISAAEATMVSYEVEGQRFSYSTKDREQVAVARQRMNAAKNAAAARAKADDERTTNPLVGLFGSPTQNEAKTAEAQLHEALSNAPRSSQPTAPRETTSHSRTTSAHPKSQAVRPAKQAATSMGSVVATQAASNVEAIVFDFASGIKTVQMADGSVEEDLFDPAMVASVKRDNSFGRPRITSSTSIKWRHCRGQRFEVAELGARKPSSRECPGASHWAVSALMHQHAASPKD